MESGNMRAVRAPREVDDPACEAVDLAGTGMNA